MDEKDLTIVALGAVAIAAIGVALKQKETIRRLKFGNRIEKITTDVMKRCFESALGYITDEDVVAALNQNVNDEIKIAVIEMENLL